ncbi:hypothetical protein [Flavobacterium humi]|uniref:DUF3300 domain-containing protein n=1 Tax=Flavobacterium humi TaxID=2562683 RepID=A0A4Z0L5G5_9FLAO|nr:hypothetical protein [Flavobacterium humi]TGD57198.1 hypothetical protein E4635_13620 [Flavobacterium humi]
MKKITYTLMVVLGMASGYSQQSENPEYTGDDFSLEGALAVFKNSSTLEEFEKRLNEENSNVNNLDLNKDGETDYIVVEDIKENNNHVIVLSTYLNANEKQDIATIGIEKTAAAEAILEITGNDELYADNTIVEPFEAEQSIGNSKPGPAAPEIITNRIVVNVWFWPSVRFLYAPGYVVWVSPHHWGYYPHWWKPWKVYHHRFFYKRCAPHRVYFHRAPSHRIVMTGKIYAPKRHSSTLVVKNRRSTTVMHKNRKGTIKTVKSPRRGRR